ncbi:hypothetical protein BDZ89DRAFT_902805, partial [Hymenopellis radicata]
PVTVMSIPWPVLYAPNSINSETINETNIRAFFTYAKTALSWEEYKNLVRTSRIHFHPDKWHSR